MVAKSKLGNKQKFKKLTPKKPVKSAKAAKTNARKPKRAPVSKIVKAPPPKPIQNEPDSDQGEDMLEMVDEDDLEFLKNAIDNRSYSLFNKVRFAEGKGKKRKILAAPEDATLENDYEDENDDKPKVKVKALLPIKTKHGIVQRDMEQEDVEEEEEEEEPVQENGADSSDEDDEGNYVLEDSTMDLSKPITPAQLLMARNEILERKKIHIGTLSSGLLENPEDKVTNFRTLLKLLDDDTPEVYVTVRKLVIVALLEVFKDLLPQYQIKLQDIDGVKVKKDTLRLHKYEESLLQYYKKYLQKLEKFAGALYKKRGDSRVRTQGERNIGEVAVHSMCDLLIAHPYFNYAQNLAQAVVPFLNNPNRNIRILVGTAMKTVFKDDKKEEITLKILRVINNYLKHHSHNVNPEMLEIFLTLRIKEVNLDQEKEIEIKNKKLNAHKANILTKLSKKEKKRKKRMAGLEQELLETKAEESKQTKAQNLTEITKILFGIYFRILKSSTNPRVLGVCLEGLAKFAHCINLEFYVDIVNVLDKLLGEEWMGYREKLHCIQTVFAILGGQGESLNLDPTRFYVNLYSGMLETHAGRNHDNFTILLHTVMVGIITRRKKITNKRIVGFVKRLVLLSMQLLHNGALSCLGVVKTIMQLVRAVDILLDVDSEVGNGKYDSELIDPEYCNASSTALYELALLAKHYHPIVAKYAVHIAHGVPASGEGSLPPLYGKCTPEDLLSDFDMSQMAFNPSIPVPKKVQAKAKATRHTYLDQGFRDKCYKRIKRNNIAGTHFVDFKNFDFELE